MRPSAQNPRPLRCAVAASLLALTLAAVPAAASEGTSLRLFHGPDDTGVLTLTALRVVLDGKELSAGLPAGDASQPIYAGGISAGLHRLEVEASLEAHSTVFTYTDGYRFRMRSQLDVEMLSGEAVDIRSSVVPQRGITTRWEDRYRLVLTLSQPARQPSPTAVAIASEPSPAASAPSTAEEPAAPASPPAPAAEPKDERSAAALEPTPAPASEPAAAPAPAREPKATPVARAPEPQPAPAAAPEPTPAPASEPAAAPAPAREPKAARVARAPEPRPAPAAAPEPTPAPASEPAAAPAPAREPKATRVARAPEPRPAPAAAPEPTPAPASEPAAAPAPAREPKATRVARAPEPRPAPPAGSEGCRLEPVFFAFDSVTLSANARGALDRFAACLGSAPLRVRLEGQCDPRGAAEYNRWLAWDRAAAVAAYLSGRGVPASRLKARVRDVGGPACEDGSEGCFAQLRRVEAVLLE
jgi:outer membrane protein OmpA-like peptidoglycan-associated protein